VYPLPCNLSMSEKTLRQSSSQGNTLCPPSEESCFGAYMIIRDHRGKFIKAQTICSKGLLDHKEDEA